MAIFSVNLRPFTRSKGESAVAAAAYRAGIALTDDRTGIRHDYTRRKGVVAVDMVMPADAPPWAGDLGAFWNQVEAAETRINSRVARELLVALPHELSDSRRQALARGIAQDLVDRYRVGVQVALHAPDGKGDDRNHHAHLLLTTRTVGPEGLGAKIRCLDDRDQGPKEVEAIRAMVAALTNAELQAAESGERVDHRTLAAQAEEAERAGDFDRAARLTREPTLRVPRAEVEEARRGRVSPALADNRDRKVCHVRDLAVYQAAVGPEGRQRLRQAVQKRWEARKAKGLRPVGVPAPTPVLRNKRRGLEEDLLDTVRAGARLASAVIQATGQRDRLANRLTHLDSTAMMAARQRAAEARLALEAAQGEARQRKSRLRQAALDRAATQKAWDTGLGPRPKAWRPTQRQAWEHNRKQLWGRLRKAIAAEREAEQDLGPVARAALRSKVAEARKKLAEAEAKIRRRPEPEPTGMPGPVPQPGDRSRPRLR